MQGLAELQSRGIPHTDDSPKYSYVLQHDGTYGTYREFVLDFRCPRSLFFFSRLLHNLRLIRISAFDPCRASVLALYTDQGLVSEVTEGQRCSVLFDRTCFYAEQGGQSHDTGYFTKDGLQVSLTTAFTFVSDLPV